MSGEDATADWQSEDAAMRKAFGQIGVFVVVMALILPVASYIESREARDRAAMLQVIAKGLDTTMDKLLKGL
jgi:hypothetical protein